MSRVLALAYYILLLPDFIQGELGIRFTYRLGKPLMGDDGVIYSCSGKFLYAFKSNGSMLWNAHLNYTCNGNIAPVYGGEGKVYIIAENQVLRINVWNHGTSHPIVVLSWGNASTQETSKEVLGLSTSMSTSSVYINIKNEGLFAYSKRGKLRWNALPVLNQFGYSQGCQKNVTNCYFTSSPIIDSCENSVYISNNEGELYSISNRSPRFKWIQNLSSFGKLFTATPGNNGFLYVTVPAKATVLGLDASTGNILWQKSIGPLSSELHAPVVDSNGWLSIGSLDGFLYSLSPAGILKKFSKARPLNSVIQVSPVLDCSGYAVYISQTEMEGKISRVIGDYTFISAMKPKSAVFWLFVPATETLYWSAVYPGEFAFNLSQSDLKKFTIDEEIFLAFIAAANIGNPLPCRTSDLKLSFSCSEPRPKSVSVYTGNERTILLFLLFETIILVVLAIIVRFCWIFWGKQKVQSQALGRFLDKRKNYLDVYRFESWGGSVIPTYIPGQQAGIGTDATMHDHIKKLLDRFYATKDANTRFSPTSLGEALVMGYDDMGYELWKPYLRSKMEDDMKAVSLGTKRKAEILASCLQEMKACFLDAKLNKFKLSKAMEIFFDRTNRPGVEDQNTIIGVVRRCGHCREADMVLKRKADGKLMVGCLGYPQCRNVVWLPGSISEAVVTSNTCNSCTPGPIFLIQFMFRQLEIPPNYSVNHLGCIGGCDETLRQLTEICGTGPRNSSGTTAPMRGRTPTTFPRTNTASNVQHGVCSYCRQTGHNSNDCPSQVSTSGRARSRATNNTNGRPAVTCTSCGEPGVLRTANTANNRGRKFYTCLSQDCSFFVWEDTIDDGAGGQNPSHANPRGSDDTSRGRGGRNRGRRGRGRGNGGGRGSGGNRGDDVMFVSATGEPVSGRRCFVCGDPSHFANACPSRGM